MRQIKKALAGKEDLLRGIGKEIQTRFSGDVTITKLNSTHFQGALIVDTIKDLVSLDLTVLEENPKVYVLGLHEINDGGGGLFIFNPNTPKTEHNGGTIIALGKAFPDNWDTDNASWFFETSTDLGCFERVLDEDYVTPKMFGAKGDGVSDDTNPLQYCINNNYTIKGDLKNKYLTKGNLQFKDNIILENLYITMNKDNNTALIYGSYSGLKINNCIFNCNNDNIDNFNTEMKNNIIVIKDNCFITNSEFLNCRIDALYITGNNNIISNCKFINIGDNPIVVASSYNVLTNISITDNFGDAILIKGNSNTLSDINIFTSKSGETINGLPGAGIALGTDGSSASENVLSNIFIDGITGNAVICAVGRFNSFSNININNCANGIYLGDNENQYFSSIYFNNTDNCIIGNNIGYCELTDIFIRYNNSDYSIKISNLYFSSINNINIRDAGSVYIIGEKVNIDNVVYNFPTSNSADFYFNILDSTINEAKINNLRVNIEAKNSKVSNCVVYNTGKAIHINENSYNSSFNNNTVSSDNEQGFSIGDYNATTPSLNPHNLVFLGNNVIKGGGRFFTGSNSNVISNIAGGDFSIADYADTNSITQINNIL